jgi:hypothetical protein
MRANGNARNLKKLPARAGVERGRSEILGQNALGWWESGGNEEHRFTGMARGQCTEGTNKY